MRIEDEQTMNTTLQVMDLGRRAYRPVFALQEHMVEARKAGTISDTLIMVEHDPVYTLGRNAEDRYVTATQAELKARGIDVVRTTRGGQVTYHGPGQLVGYPIIDLGARGKGVLWYVGKLEEVLIAVLAGLGIEARTDEINRGVWVGTDKVAALGIRVTRHITMHGFALNVCADLSHYVGMVPCGIEGRGVTSIDRLRAPVSMADVRQRVTREFAERLGYNNVVAVPPPEDQ